MDTKKKLMNALIELFDLGEIPLSPLEIVTRASGGYYHDYDSPLESPLIQLVNDINSLGLGERGAEFCKRVMDGEFDATREESDSWMEREGGAILQQMAGGKDEEAVAVADGSVSTYLCRRLLAHLHYLLQSSNFDTKKVDIFMALHNFHTWGLLDLVKDQDSKTKVSMLYTALTTFQKRIEADVNRAREQQDKR